ncbi:type II secretion system minor pseudopilin GspK [Sphingosinicella terrae]|jgi:general secretion pathway protein K|uniref:type II secretion system minor pseudopilin GspK n=1 Tax=Sphingosinicella terrae TaxID=2172047 RepID=UPI000E0DD13F|nr:type II secretion system minor pseudopilin GspK [Sphingosinicella terrae]
MTGPRVPAHERGAALLAVLLLVAVTGAIAATALEKMSLSRAVAANGNALDQARAFARGAEDLAMLAIDDMVAASPDRTTLDGGWNGAVRRIALPGGGFAEARLRDGGNCFNVNSVVEGDRRTRLTRRHSGVLQLAGLMQALEVAEPEARRVAEAAADWADSDSRPGPGGAEDGAYAEGGVPYRTANSLFADVGELSGLPGMTPQIMARLRPWLCVLPVTELSPINVNTLMPEQAPLLAMLAPGQLDVQRARRVLAARPTRGWSNQVEFWRIDALRGVDVPLDVQLQVQLRTRWFAIDTRVAVMESEFSEEALVDARLQPSRLASRSWGD